MALYNEQYWHLTHTHLLSLSSLRKRLATAAQPGGTEGPLLLEYTRILTKEDFERIRELRHKRLVDAALAKHGLQSASLTAHRRDRIMAAAEEEAEELLEFQVLGRMVANMLVVMMSVEKISNMIRTAWF